MTDVATFVIRSTGERDDETGRPLFWSNDDGWVDRNSATVFSQDEAASKRLPMAGEWVPNDCADGHDADVLTVRPSHFWRHIVDIDCARCGHLGLVRIDNEAIDWSVEP